MLPKADAPTGSRIGAAPRTREGSSGPSPGDGSRATNRRRRHPLWRWASRVRSSDREAGQSHVAGAARAEIAPVEDHLEDGLGFAIGLPLTDCVGGAPGTLPPDAPQREMRRERPVLRREAHRAGGGLDEGGEPLDPSPALDREPEDAGAPPAWKGTGGPRTRDHGIGGSCRLR